ncbi:phospholipase D-like domain-containing protein [Allopontixanthobacter sediminis]
MGRRAVERVVMGEERSSGVGGAPAELPPFSISAQGQDLTFYPAGKDRLDRLLEMIGGARESVRMCFYIFAIDDTGRQVRDALVAAAERGVAVTLIIDGFGADADAEFLQPLSDAGGNWHVFSSGWSQRYLIRNHQKMVIADGTAMLGGFNIADDYFAPPKVNGWNDLAVTLEGSAVSQLSRWFDELERWSANPRSNWLAVSRMIREWSPGSGPVRLLIGGPTRTPSSWAQAIRADLVRGRRLDMVMAYFSPASRMARRIGNLARRGTARLVMAGKSDNNATIGAARSMYAYLLGCSARVWEFTACKLHTKLIVIDDAVYFGSANFDMRSLYVNLELMLRIEDAALADRMRKFIGWHIAASEEITPQVNRRRATLFNRIRWNLAWFIVAVVDYNVSRQLNLGL